MEQRQCFLSTELLLMILIQVKFSDSKNSNISNVLLSNILKADRFNDPLFCKYALKSLLASVLYIFLRMVTFSMVWYTNISVTALKMKFSIKDFFSKCDHIRKKLRIWSHLLKKSLMENFIFCAVRPFSRVLRILKKLSNCHYQSINTYLILMQKLVVNLFTLRK